MPESPTPVASPVLPGAVSRVRSGSIGIAAAADSPWREVRVRIHDFTGGVSHVALADAAASGSLADGVTLLAARDDTEVVVVVGAADAPEQTITAIERTAGLPLPAVLCVVDPSPAVVAAAAAHGVALQTRTKPTALAAVVASGVDESTLDLHSLNLPLIAEVRAMLDDGQRHVRGLLRERGVWQESTALVGERYPGDSGHRLALFDAPGPDPRADELVQAVGDPGVGAVLIDFPLGDGADPDPVSALLPAIKRALGSARATGRVPAVLGYVQGTELDPQNLAAQVEALVGAGVIWASSATNAALLAREFVAKD